MINRTQRRALLLTALTSLSAVVGLLTGCVSSPTRENGTASAYSVGDRASVFFDEVVVSLQLKGSSDPFQNLHVVPAALVNVRQKTYSTSYEAENILRRLEARVSARLSEMLSTLGEQSLADTASLRRRILEEAQKVVDDALRHWEHGRDYQVEMVVASLYWTDGSATRSSQPRRWGW